MDRLLTEIEVEKEYLKSTFEALDMVMQRKNKGLIELAATATFLHNAYNGMENLIKRILKHIEISIVSSESWHKDLLNLAIENKIISIKLSNKLDEFRAFRHFFTHGYGINLDKNKLLPLAEKLPDVWEQFQKELDHYLKENKNEE